MFHIEKRNAMKAFYYLMAVDNDIDEEELDTFEQIGAEILESDFEQYKEDIIECCNTQITSAISEIEKYDVIQEGLDDVLNGSENKETDIPIRLLIWNMLVIAFCNNTYSEAEQKLINHVVRKTKTDRNILMEMEHTIKAYVSVKKQIEWIESTDKPYSEVRPIVEELEKRQENLLENAHALVLDEVEAEEVYVPKTDIIDKAKEKVGEKLAPIAHDIGEKVNPIAAGIGEKAKKTAESAKNAFGEKVVPAAKDLKSGAGKMFDKLKEKAKKKSASDNAETITEPKE